MIPRKQYKQYRGSQRWRASARRLLAKRDGNCCFYCNYIFTPEFSPTIEHLVAVASGGGDDLANLVLACEPCNKKVGSWPLIKKIKYREYRHKTQI